MELQRKITDLSVDELRAVLRAPNGHDTATLNAVVAELSRRENKPAPPTTDVRIVGVSMSLDDLLPLVAKITLCQLAVGALIWGLVFLVRLVVAAL